MDLRSFWKWSAFEDYLLFCFGFTALCTVVTFLLLDSALFVETLGSLAVMFEAMLGLPQLLQNLHNRSTKGMRYGRGGSRRAFAALHNSPGSFWQLTTPPLRILMRPTNVKRKVLSLT